MKRIILLLSLLFTFLRAHSQDPIFTQFYANPLYLAPSFTGSAVDHRITVINKQQYYKVGTRFISYDNKLKDYNSSIGFSFLNDYSMLNNTAFTFSYSYDIKTHSKFHVRPGVSVSYNRYSINVNKLRFLDEIQNQSPTSIEDLPIMRDDYFDINTSILFYNKKSWFGMKYAHLGWSKMNFFDQERIPMLVSVFGSVNIREVESSNISLAGNYVWNSPFQQLSLGINYNRKIIIFGLWYRGIPYVNSDYGDAISAVIGLRKTKKFYLGYSIDVNLNNMITSSMGGNHEVSFIFQFGNKKKKTDFVSNSSINWLYAYDVNLEESKKRRMISNEYSNHGNNKIESTSLNSQSYKTKSANTYSSIKSNNNKNDLDIVASHKSNALKSIHVELDTFPPSANFILDNYVGCAPLSVYLMDISSYNYPSLNKWVINDTLVINEDSEYWNYTFKEPGTYNIKLCVTGIDSIESLDSIIKQVIVHPLPEVSFIKDSPNVQFVTNEFHFRNFTQGAVEYFWDFGDGEYSTEVEPYHTYYEYRENIYVTLIATSEYGCVDSMKSNNFDVSVEISINIPNAFTPNGDGLNDYFMPDYNNIKDYKIKITNRWGGTVYFSEGKDGNLSGLSWNGKGYRSNQPMTTKAPVGVYIYLFTGKYLNDKPFLYRGDLLLIR